MDTTTQAILSALVTMAAIAMVGSAVSAQENGLEAELLGLAKGDEVAAIGGPTGLRVVTSRGKTIRTLLRGHVMWAAVDRRGQVIWVQRRTKKAKTRRLELIDLLGDGSPVVIIDSVSEDVEEIVVSYGDERLGGPDENIGIRVVLGLSGYRPTLKTEEGNFYFRVTQQQRALAVALELQSVDLLKRVAARAKGRRLSPLPARKGLPARLKIVPTSACELPDVCGEVSALPGTPYWSVVTGHGCGDGCYIDSQIYDPDRKLFFDPFKPQRTSKTPLPDGSGLRGAWISPSGKLFSVAGALVSFRSGAAVDPPGDVSAGWLGGGWGWRIGP